MADSPLLESALKSQVRQRHGFNVLFADLDKIPRVPWARWQKEHQSDEDVRGYFNAMGDVSCWGWVTGYRGLQAGDFDWPWVYRLWKARFGERTETLTIQTPNGGFRPHYICAQPVTNDTFKESLHTELKGPGRFVVYEGRVKRDDGAIGEYQVVKDGPVRADDAIIGDTLTFLKDVQKRYRFLYWSCLRPHFSRKVLGSPPHAVRLFITDVMACDGFSYEEILNLFRACSDFDQAKTGYQVHYTLDRVKAGLKPPTCDTLRQTLGWSEGGCRGCPRRGMAKREEGIDLGGYRLTTKGKKAYLIDETGQLVLSGRAESMDGPRFKKKIREITGVKDEEIDRSVAVLSFSAQPKDREEEVQLIEGLKRIETSLSEKELEGKALQILRSPDLLFRVKLIYEKGVIVDRYRFVLGENDKKLLMFLIGASAKTGWPQSLWATGGSGFGKSNMVVVTLTLMPSGYAKVRSYMTGAGLRYGSQDYKVLFIREWRQFAEQDIRLVSREDGSYTYEIAVRDPETNEWTTQVGEIPAKTIMTTSAERLPSAQMLRRCWLLSVDETPELTKLINIRKAEHRSGKAEPTSPVEIAVVQRAVSLLQPVDVTIPYANLMVDLAPWDRTRLDYLFDIISVIAWLHQHQRGRDGRDRVVATPADLYMAMRICWATLMQSLMQLPERLKRCWAVLPKDAESEGKTTKQLALELGLSQSTIRGYLNDLVNLNYAVRAEKERSRGFQYWGVAAHAASVECVESTVQQLKWAEIASLTERSVEQASLQHVLNGGGEHGLFFVCDPLTGKNIPVMPPLDSTHVPEDGEKAFFDRKKADLGFSSVESTVQHIQHFQRVEFGDVKLTLGELESILRKEWTSGYEADFITLAVKKGWTEEEAERLFDQRKGNQILRDPDGFWRYV